jgi:hypothetical protein
LLNQHFDLQVDLKISKYDTRIEEVLSTISLLDEKNIKLSAYDFKKSNGDKQLLISRTANTLRLVGDDTEQARQYASDYLIIKPKTAALLDFSEALVETQLARLSQWRNFKSNEGKSLIDESLANEYLMWLTYVAKYTKVQLVLTNQLIASAEYLGNSVHSSIRGGVSNGFTSHSSKSTSGVASVVSLFPFISDDRITMSLRDGFFENQDMRNEAIALMIVHELGHQLVRLGHPFENKNCVMNPPKLLHFNRWLLDIKPNFCKLNSNQGMKPGIIKFLDTR